MDLPSSFPTQLVVLIVCLGSLVDILQFAMFVRRWYVKFKRRMYNRIRDELRGEYGAFKATKSGATWAQHKEES